MEELAIDECLALLDGRCVGRLAFIDDGQPVIVPVNYVLHDGSVLFRTGRGGKLDAAVRRSRVAFEVDGVDEDARTGWSVLVKGRCDEIWRPEDLERVRGVQLEPWAKGERDHYVRIWSSEITGRRIKPDATMAYPWWG